MGNRTWQEIQYSYNLKLAQIYENVSSKLCKLLASFLTQKNARYSDLAIANLAFSMINTILTFTFSSKLSGKYSVGSHDFSNYKQMGVRKKHTGIKGGGIVFHTQQVPNCPALPPLISNEQSLMYQSIPSLTIPPPAILFMGEFPTPRQKRVQNPHLPGLYKRAKTPPRGAFSSIVHYKT